MDILRGRVMCVFCGSCSGRYFEVLCSGEYFEVSCRGGALRGLIEVSCSWDILRCSPDHYGYLEMYYCN